MDVLRYDQEVFQDNNDLSNLKEAYQIVDMIYDKRKNIQQGVGIDGKIAVKEGVDT